MKKIIFIVLILSIATFAGIALNRNAFGVKENKVAAVISSINGQKLRKAELTITGMWCVSCATGAEYSLKSIDGVEDAFVGFTDNLDGNGWVIYQPDKVSRKQIIKAVEPYKAKIISDSVYTETK